MRALWKIDLNVKLAPSINIVKNQSVTKEILKLHHHCRSPRDAWERKNLASRTSKTPITGMQEPERCSKTFGWYCFVDIYGYYWVVHLYRYLNFEYIQCKIVRIYGLWSISWSTTLFRVSKKVTVLYRNILQNCDVLLTRLKYDIIMKAKLFGDHQGTVFVFNYFLSQYKMDFFLQILFSRIKHYCREQRIVGIWLEQVCSTSYSLDLLANTYQ